MDPASLAWARQAPRTAANVSLSFHPVTRVRDERGDRLEPAELPTFIAPARLIALAGDEIPDQFRSEVRQLWSAAATLPPNVTVERTMQVRSGVQKFAILALVVGEGCIAAELVLAEIVS